MYTISTIPSFSAAVTIIPEEKIILLSYRISSKKKDIAMCLEIISHLKYKFEDANKDSQAKG